jgi:sugar phosphate isomerase/epimerase
MKIPKKKIRFTDGNDNKPGVFLAQFAEDKPPFNNLPNIGQWAAGLGFGSVQIPSWDRRFIDLDAASKSKGWCDDNITGPLVKLGLRVSHLATHLQGQLMAQNPAQQPLFACFGPKKLARDPEAQFRWAQGELKKAIRASENLGCRTVFSFTGNFLFPYVYPWPPRPAELVKAAFLEQGRRWKPVLNFASEHGQKVAMEVHPQEDAHDGVSFEMFHESTGKHEALGIALDASHFILQALDYIAFIKTYGSLIYGAHWKDAELNPSGRQGVYCGYQPFISRAGRFRSLGDGQLDLVGMEKALADEGLSLFRTLEWEDTLKDKEQGAEEGAKILQAVIDDRPIPKPKAPRKAAGDFEKFAGAGAGVSKRMLEKCLGFRIPDTDARKLKLGR